jgi:hypothetical protein
LEPLYKHEDDGTRKNATVVLQVRRS